jgi:hypothetical protein
MRRKIIHINFIYLHKIYETGEWPKGFAEITIIALKKKPHATKCSDNRTISRIAHTANIIVKILRRRIDRKIEAVLGEVQFGSQKADFWDPALSLSHYNGFLFNMSFILNIKVSV